MTCREVVSSASLLRVRVWAAQNSKKDNGVTVADVRAGTCADQYLKVGDIVAKVGNKPVLGLTVDVVNTVRLLLLSCPRHRGDG